MHQAGAPRSLFVGLILLAAITGCSKKSSSPTAPEPLPPSVTYEFVQAWGDSGAGAGQFRWPQSAAVDAGGNVYVADNDHRIQKFTRDGVFVTQWGEFGSGDGQFFLPTGLAVDGGGNVYVTDCNNHRIQKFTADGAYVTQWGTQGGGNGQFGSPHGVAVDSTGDVYVADTDNHRAQRFTLVPQRARGRASRRGARRSGPDGWGPRVAAREASSGRHGAGAGSRTRTGVSPADFKSAASSQFRHPGARLERPGPSWARAPWATRKSRSARPGNPRFPLRRGAKLPSAPRGCQRPISAAPARCA